MRRVLAPLLTLLICVAVGAAVALAVMRFTGAGSNGYLVRAVFDNSSFVIPGEEVKVAGVTVGTIKSIELTPRNQAALVLQITNHTFVPFRSGTHCTIDLESLLGEQYVQCTTGAANSGAQPAPLPAISSGPNSGQHLLAATDTTTPIGFDLLQDIQRLPQQEVLRELIDGLGDGFDANGQELNAALRSADPALQETDDVISVLASQNQTLARLTDESARVLAPLAAQRAHLGGFFVHAGTVASASAAVSKEIEQNLTDLPPFLDQLIPAADRLSALAQQFTPALQSLQAQAPAINAATQGLGPLAEASVPAVKSLGTVAAHGETIFPELRQVSGQLLSLSTPLQPLADNLAKVSSSFDTTGGIEDVMRFIFYYSGLVNGEDSLGHYLRAHVTLGAVQRTSTPQGAGSSATFACSLETSACPAGDGTSASVRSASASGSSASLRSARTLFNYLIGP